MSIKVEQVIESIEGLSSEERAFIAHYLISSIEGHQDDDVDPAWLAIAEQRIAELNSG